MNRFADDLAFEQEHARYYHLLWGAFLQTWGDNLSGILYETRRDRQFQGVDWIVALHNGRQITMDAKIRRTDYGDIALEYVHEQDDGTQRPGWVEKPLSCDFVCYLIAPSRLVYLIPRRRLQKWWLANRDKLLDLYPIARSPNPEYVSLSCCIPVPVILAAIPTTRTIQT